MRQRELGLIPHNQPAGHLVVILPAFCPQIAPGGPFLPVMPVRKYCAVYNLRFELFHGMEEVVGLIPTRSTNSFKPVAPPPFRGFVASSSQIPKPRPELPPANQFRFLLELPCVSWRFTTRCRTAISELQQSCVRQAGLSARWTEFANTCRQYPKRPLRASTCALLRRGALQIQH